MNTVLIVGKKLSALTDYLGENGYDYIFLQDITTTKFPDKKFKHRVLGDFSTKESLIVSLKGLKKSPDAVIVTYENYILPASWVSEYFNLPGLPAAAAEACTDKFLMRSLFDLATEKISPAFEEVKNEKDLLEFASQHSLPLILKPANLAKSLLVTKNDTVEELLTNYHKSVNLLQTTYKKYAPNRQPKLIIEEFLEGSIHSVDAFIDSQGEPNILEHIVDYQTGYDIGYSDNFHYSRILPSALSQADQQALRHCAKVGIKALGMKNSPAHVEIIMTATGPRIVEIGARNGGYRERMHLLANGIDLTKARIELARGITPIINTLRNDSCAVLELFPKVPGIFDGISHEIELQKLSSFEYISIKAKKDTYVGKSADGYKTCAVVILHNSDAEQFSKDVSFIGEFVHVITK